MNRLCEAVFLVAFSASHVTAQSATTAPPVDLDAWVARAMNTFHTQGVAVAVVKDGKLVHSRGYGVRRMGASEKVDADTLFGIASNTKAFTATALAMLADEGKLDWDDRVIDRMPEFRMSDAYVTREITIRDLLTHRSGMGLGAGDLMFFPDSDFTREQIIFNQRYIPLSTSFRSRYAYDNVLYVAAGQIIPKVTSKSWDDFIRERIFTPLGMTNSSTSVAALRPGVNYATPHAVMDGTLQPVKNDHVDNTGPAGAINSSVSDLAKWVTVRLNGGAMADGKRLYSAKQAKEMWAGQTILPIGDGAPELTHLRPHFAEYGLGVSLRDYRGRKLVTHTGGLTGYVSQIVLAPEENLGIIILTNGEAGETFNSIGWHVVDHYLGAPPRDYIAAFETVKTRREKEAKDTVAKASAARNRESRPSLPLEKYAGLYRDAWYGEATVGVVEGRLNMKFARSTGLNGTLEHFQYDTFVAKWAERTVPDAYVTFSMESDGGIRDLRLKAVSPLADFSYDFQDLLFLPARR